ncbi:hypothetical protein NEIFL0001_0708 [Neisseria flavescens SK114]|nr:hypothetical protein NEIFL0001_0708 [Neisseria flavescens SK114]
MARYCCIIGETADLLMGMPCKTEKPYCNKRPSEKQVSDGL